MATKSEYPSVWTGSQIDIAIQAVRQNLDSFQNLNDNINRITALETLIGNGDSGLSNAINQLQSTISGGTLDPSKTYNFLPISGGSMNIDSQINVSRPGGGFADAHNKAVLKFEGSSLSGYVPIYSFLTSNHGYISCGLVHGTENAIEWRRQDTDYLENSNYLSKLTDTGIFLGACWNDYAEFRETDEICAGRVVCENGDGTLSRSNKRLQAGAQIVSDTYGFAIGETEKCKTPIAVSGRVLAYPYEDWWTFEPGEPVCAGPDGTVSKMTRREVRKYPDRIIGIVSELPTYEYWGDNKIPVNGRIWIKVK